MKHDFVTAQGTLLLLSFFRLVTAQGYAEKEEFDIDKFSRKPKKAGERIGGGFAEKSKKREYRDTKFGECPSSTANRGSLLDLSFSRLPIPTLHHLAIAHEMSQYTVS
jgi:hypothetical protein